MKLIIKQGNLMDLNLARTGDISSLHLYHKCIINETDYISNYENLVLKISGMGDRCSLDLQQ